MEQRLLKSFITLVIFYSLIGVFGWAFYSGVFSGDIINAGFLGSLQKTFIEWSLPVFAFVVFFFLVGAGSYHLRIYLKKKKNKNRLVGTSYHGVNSSLGALPKPEWLAEKEISKINLTLGNKVSNIYRQLPKEHQTIFTELVAYLHSHTNAYVGEGHASTLLEHSINVLLELVEVDDDIIKDPLTMLIALSHDIGKVISHTKSSDDSSWIRNGNHDEFSGLIISTMPSFMKLSLEDRQILTLVLKYSHKKNKTPFMRTEKSQKRLEELQKVLSLSDQKATKKEKETILKKLDVNSVFEDIFSDTLVSSRFMSKDTRAGVKVDAFRHSKNQVFLVENRIREKFLSRMTPEQQAVFNKGKRSKGNVSVVTQKLVAWLEKKGYLVSKHNEHVVKNGLWNVMSGTVLLKGMILIELPEDMLRLIPEGEPRYPLEIEGPTSASSRDTRPPRQKVKSRNPDNEQNPDKPKNERRSLKPPGMSGGSQEGKRRIERKNNQSNQDNQDKDELLKALEAKKAKIAQANAKELEAAKSRMAKTLGAYDYAVIELKFNAEEHRMKVESPYYQAQLKPQINVSKGVRKERKMEQSFNTSSHMAMVMASLG